jgi:hypothetical protein
LRKWKIEIKKSRIRRGGGKIDIGKWENEKMRKWDTAE